MFPGPVPVLSLPHENNINVSKKLLDIIILNNMDFSIF